MDYIEKIKNNELARIVKKSDLLDNMNLKRLKNIKESDLERLEKYIKAYKELLWLYNKIKLKLNFKTNELYYISNKSLALL